MEYGLAYGVLYLKISTNLRVTMTIAATAKDTRTILNFIRSRAIQPLRPPKTVNEGKRKREIYRDGSLLFHYAFESL